MAFLPKPNEPLRILTIDGGGLKAKSTILTLDKLLNAIAQNNGAPDSKPRPCDVFDVIAGIGPGGWLALFLGRFQMDLFEALKEGYNLIDCDGPMFRVPIHSDTDLLVKEHIDELTECYQTGKHMFFTPPEGTRCKHVFVSALKTDSKDRHPGYNLFRIYDCSQGSNVLESLQNPRECKISHAFAATGAAKYFTPHRRQLAAIRAISKVLGIQSQSSHNVTELALNEMWGLYGRDVEISVVINIGPGIPNDPDLRNIARSFSWGTKEPRSPALLTRKESFQSNRSHDHEPPDGMPHHASGITHQIKSDQTLPGPVGEVARKTPVTRQTTCGSEVNVGIEEQLRTDESKIEFDIREKLRNIYPEHTSPYYRLPVPEGSAPSSARAKQHLHPPIIVVHCETGAVDVLRPQRPVP